MFEEWVDPEMNVTNEPDFEKEERRGPTEGVHCHEDRTPGRDRRCGSVERKGVTGTGIREGHVHCRIR